jgi:hypothetical protein
MYVGLMMIGRQKYKQQSLVSEPSAFEFAMATEKLKEANRLLLIKSKQN